MTKQKKDFPDDLENDNINNKEPRNLNQYDTPREKWNDIQEEYLKKHKEINLEDLYFEAGGFERVVEKIAEVRGISISEVRKEIEEW
ncbi:hypothetical protein [Arenibacter certesii]|uniref:Uncharacterized protein n=1 Tax=Arenibacter certesii TaxID=228955 RepID=A0A918J6H0_9FLAO|nr:hypothetical protein [Arenibacter certesii]GGW45432.1 hypothetical protein GCM10007383_32270 [Arenibacter certesii]